MRGCPRDQGLSKECGIVQWMRGCQTDKGCPTDEGMSKGSGVVQGMWGCPMDEGLSKG